MEPKELCADIQVLPDREMRFLAPRTSLNRLCDVADWEAGSELTETMRELQEGVYIHRKAWEYALCVLGLRQLGVVRTGARAIAVGAGSERPLYYFANHIEEMIATDLYEFPGHEGDPKVLVDPAAFAPFEYRRDHLTVRHMDAKRLDYEDNSFDFAYCLSSIEHFGTRQDSVASMREIHRVLRPGGVASIATELILNETTHPEYFTLDELYDTLINSTPLELVGGDLDLRISRSLVQNPIVLDVETNHHISPHIVLQLGDCLWTSAMLFLQKPR